MIKDEELAFKTYGKYQEICVTHKNSTFLRLADVPKAFIGDMRVKFPVGIKINISAKDMNAIFAINKAAEQQIGEAALITIENNSESRLPKQRLKN